ncbi:MAG: HdeD family acid-resistance protein [Candidatus Saccharimonadaceae bacterium]
MAKQGANQVAKQLWGLGIAFGVVSILFGVLALFWPGLTVALFIVLFGVFVLVWGVVGLIVSLSSANTDKFWWLELVFSLLAIGLAVYLLRNPVEAAKFFVLFMGLTFLVRGVVDVLEGLFDAGRKGSSRVSAIVLGAIGLVAGVITLTYPVSAGLAVVWVIGLYAVLYGSMLVAFSFRVQAELGR